MENRKKELLKKELNKLKIKPKRYKKCFNKNSFCLLEKLIQNSLDKSKLDKIYSSSIEETKLALKKKSS